MSYKFRLDIFEGPLDLLLYLIKKNEIDIYNIPVAVITEQYLEYVEAMKALDLDLAGEYLVLAATLIHIKSRMLLPAPDDETEDGEDPREELVRQLLEYKTFKEAALNLNSLTLLGRDIFGRAFNDEEDVEGSERTIKEIGIFELVEAFRSMVARSSATEIMEIDVEQVSLAERINEVIDELNKKKTLTFSDLIGEISDKMRLIYTFLAILELVKLRIIKVYQTVSYGTIRIRLAVEK
jgi:segregation and condensation protein A